MPEATIAAALRLLALTMMTSLMLPIYAAASTEVALSSATYDLVSGTFSGTISVENIAYAKTVTVYYSSPAGSWSTSNAIAAAYSAASSTSGYEYWTFSTTTAAAGAALGPGSQYYIAYTVSGSTYYDNNSAANYLVAGSWSYTPYASAPTDGAEVRLNSVTLSENGTTVLSGVLWIDNIAYAKTVQACYSASGSSASTCVAAAYQAAASGVYETWTFSATDSSIAIGSSVSFSYAVSGSTYSDGPYVLGTSALPTSTSTSTDADDVVLHKLFLDLCDACRRGALDRVTKAMDPDSDYSLFLNGLFNQVAGRKIPEPEPGKAYDQSTKIADILFLCQQWRLVDLQAAVAPSVLDPSDPAQPPARKATRARDVARVRSDLARLVHAINAVASDPNLSLEEGLNNSLSVPDADSLLLLLRASAPDLRVHVGGVAFLCHRAFVQQSEYFSTMLSSGFQEGDGAAGGTHRNGRSTAGRAPPPPRNIKLSFISDPRVFSVVLEFLYTDRVDSMPTEIAGELLDAADYLLLDRLKTRAVSHVLAAPSPFARVARPDRLLRRAWAMNLERLAQACNRWFAENLLDLVPATALFHAAAGPILADCATLVNGGAGGGAPPTSAAAWSATPGAVLDSDDDEDDDEDGLDNGDNDDGAGGEEGDAGERPLLGLPARRRARTFLRLVQDSADDIRNRQETDSIVFVDDLRWWIDQHATAEPKRGQLHAVVDAALDALGIYA
ncbi:hypothetical protein HK405_009432 [Cladochytrium tenue]|nr:hypothetical protein HK405_009432 [Cladochytrium tenue]